MSLGESFKSWGFCFPQGHWGILGINLCSSDLDTVTEGKKTCKEDRVELFSLSKLRTF